MASPNVKKLDPVVTESVLERKLEKFEDRMDKKLQHYFREFSLEITKGIQVMFDEQNRQNDEKFATKVEVQLVREDVRELKDRVTTLEKKFDQNYTLLVDVVGNIKKILENQTTSDYRQAHHSDQLTQHETRINTIEHHLGLAS